MKPMIESKNMTAYPSSMPGFDKTGFEKLGFNQKFLETETGCALAQALSILRTYLDYAPDDEAEQEDAPADNLEGVTLTIDVKD